MGVGAMMGIQGAGAVTSAFGAYTQGLAQSNYFKYLAANSRTEAGLVTREGQQQATLAENAGAEESKISARKTLELQGAQTAASGANVGGGSGTTADIAADTINKSRLDQLAIKYNADVQAWNSTEGAKLRAFSLNREAAGYDVSAGAAKSAGKMGAFNSLLSGAGQIASTWYQNQPFAKTSGKTALVGGKRVPVAPDNYWLNNGGG